MANTVAYEWPVTGATAPTAAQSKEKNIVSGLVTGDGASTSITLTHNWGLSAAALAAGFPEVQFEPVLAAGLTAAPWIAAKAANSITITCTAFAGAALRVRALRPHSIVK